MSEKDHDHEVAAQCRPGNARRPWVPLVDGAALLNRHGYARRFVTEAAALEAADFDAWLRDQ